VNPRLLCDIGEIAQPATGRAARVARVPVDPEPGPLNPTLVGLVGLGGVVGTALRFGFTQWIPTGHGWPWATLLVNLLGALILGALLETLSLRDLMPATARRTRLLVGTGFCGGLTTYSTLAVETGLLVHAHRAGLAAGYAVVSIVAGAAAASIGVAASAYTHRGRT